CQRHRLRGSGSRRRGGGGGQRRRWTDVDRAGPAGGDDVVDRPVVPGGRVVLGHRHRERRPGDRHDGGRPGVDDRGGAGRGDVVGVVVLPVGHRLLGRRYGRPRRGHRGPGRRSVGGVAGAGGGDVVDVDRVHHRDIADGVPGGGLGRDGAGGVVDGGRRQLDDDGNPGRRGVAGRRRLLRPGWRLQRPRRVRRVLGGGRPVPAVVELAGVGWGDATATRGDGGQRDGDGRQREVCRHRRAAVHPAGRGGGEHRGAGGPSAGGGGAGTADRADIDQRVRVVVDHIGAVPGVVPGGVRAGPHRVPGADVG